MRDNFWLKIKSSPIKLAILAIVFLTVLISLINYFTSTVKVQFEITPQDLELSLFKDEIKIKDLKSNSRLRLKPGEYLLKPADEKYQESKITIDQNSKTIKLVPEFTEKYYQVEFGEQRAKINQMIKKRYPSLIEQFFVSDIVCFNQGKFCGVLISKKPERPSAVGSTNSYRAIFEVSGGQIKQLQTPELFLSKFNAPNIDQAVLDRVNLIKQGDNQGEIK